MDSNYSYSIIQIIFLAYINVLLNFFGFHFFVVHIKNYNNRVIEILNQLIQKHFKETVKAAKIREYCQYP